MDVRKILVVGYYHRKNLGDDVFEYVLTKYFQDRFPNSTYNFISIDDLKKIPSDTSAVIFGGGDLVNDYFYEKIKPFIKRKICPWYAISIGIPYPKLIEKGYLNKFDYIIHRNKSDEVIMINDGNINKNGKKSEWFPDMSFLLNYYNNSGINSKISCNNPTGNNPIGNNPTGNNPKKIGIFLARNIYYKEDPKSYNRIIDNLVLFLSNIASKTKNKKLNTRNYRKQPEYELYLYSFCTDDTDENNDRLINQDIYNFLRKSQEYNKITNKLNNIHLISNIPMDKILEVFGSFYMTICTRFHAHMFSLMTHVPIMSIYTTRKVENLLTEMDAHEYSVKMETNSDLGHPTNINLSYLHNTFNHIVTNYTKYKSNLTSLSDKYTGLMDNFIDRLDSLIFYSPRYILPHEIGREGYHITKHITDKLIKIYNNNQVNQVNNQVNQVNNQVNDDDITDDININQDEFKKELARSNGAIMKYFGTFTDNIKDHLVELISYELTNNRFSDYHYGLKEQVFTPNYNLKESCKWILNNKLNNDKTRGNIIGNFFQKYINSEYKYLDNVKYPMNMRKLNISYINNNLFEGYHRSGWNYVLKHMEELHNPQGVIFDSYLDKTFGWDYDFLSTAQVIPYKTPWVGVFHHTANQDYSENNLVNIFSKPNFSQSLDTCKGIIVMSLHNKLFIKSVISSVINKVNKDIPILVLYHPTELVNNALFNWSKFEMNPVKKIIQIGAWLRNSYAIYRLEVPKGYYKFALKGKDMNNYFISDKDVDNMINGIKSVGSSDIQLISGNIHNNNGHHNKNHGDDGSGIKDIGLSDNQRTSGVTIPNKGVNKYIVGLIDMIEHNHKSVTVLDDISNEQYDRILTDSIVFINLVDASAVNTILECIVRNTPIVVNRLPATEEYLGVNYPLFYNPVIGNTNNTTFDPTEINKLLTLKNIKKAYNYLKSMNKSRLNINYFLNSLVNSDLYNFL